MEQGSGREGAFAGGGHACECLGEELRASSHLDPCGPQESHVEGERVSPDHPFQGEILCVIPDRKVAETGIHQIPGREVTFKTVGSAPVILGGREMTDFGKILCSLMQSIQ